jgi:hypothetical protein
LLPEAGFLAADLPFGDESPELFAGALPSPPADEPLESLEEDDELSLDDEESLEEESF